jgi:hypothetical protein
LPPPDPGARRGRSALVVAGALGTVHAGFSLYWGIGGTWLVATLGERMVTAFAGLEWVLVPVGLAKLLAAWAPVLAADRDWPARPLTRTASWLGAIALLVWGGLNTVVGHLVLGGLIRPDGGYDRAGMIGHAYLWDPLFLLWGLALAVGLHRDAGRRAPLA